MQHFARIFSRQIADIPSTKSGSETLQQQILRLSTDIMKARDELGTKISWAQGAMLICGCSVATLRGMAGLMTLLLSDLKADVKIIQNHLISGNVIKVCASLHPGS